MNQFEWTMPTKSYFFGLYKEFVYPDWNNLIYLLTQDDIKEQIKVYLNHIAILVRNRIDVTNEEKALRDLLFTFETLVEKAGNTVHQLGRVGLDYKVDLYLRVNEQDVESLRVWLFEITNRFIKNRKPT